MYILQHPIPLGHHLFVLMFIYIPYKYIAILHIPYPPVNISQIISHSWRQAQRRCYNIYRIYDLATMQILCNFYLKTTESVDMYPVQRLDNYKAPSTNKSYPQLRGILFPVFAGASKPRAENKKLPVKWTTQDNAEFTAWPSETPQRN